MLVQWRMLDGCWRSSGRWYHPAMEEGEEYVGVEEGGVDLGEGVVKVLTARAEAWEGKEKWTEAGKDWETLAGKEWARPAVKSEAVRVAGRCWTMVVQVQAHNAARPDDLNPRPIPKFKAKTRPTAAASNGLSQVPENLRNVTDAADREDQDLKIRSLGRGRARRRRICEHC
jgi:hypothetical protein